MKKLVVILVLAVGLMPLPALSQISKKLSDTLQGVLEHRAGLYQLKSLAAAVVFPDGSVWEGAYGHCGTVPTSPAMLFEMGSNTKTYTSAIILQMASEGKLKLNDTLYKFVPVHPNIAYGITIRQLLNHTSGIYNYTEHPDFFDLVNNNEDTIVGIDLILQNWVEPMIYTPGAKYSYCNTNYILLGMIIEKLDGVPYHEALRTRILNKLGFESSFMDIYETYTIPKAGTWLNDGQYWDTHFKSFMSAAWAAGALLTTPADLAKWAKALYHGEVLADSWLDSMKVTIPAGGGYRYGLGMFQFNLGGRSYVGHGGTTLQNSEMAYSLSSDFSCVTVINEQSTGPAAFYTQNALINVIETLLPGISAIQDNGKDISLDYYPNPATDHFMVSLDAEQFAKSQGLRFQLYSMTGTVLKDIEVEQPELHISRDGLPAGIYMAVICNVSGEVLSREKILLK